MKRIVLFILFLAAASSVIAALGPRETARLADLTEKGAMRVWEGVEAHPEPVVLALATFLATVVYHKLRGKSLRESVEVAATRVNVVSVPVHEAENETAVVKRAKARATWTQLVADQIALENRYRKLPDAVTKAEKDACYTEQALIDAEKKLGDADKAHEEAVAKLEALREDLSRGREELAEIEAELKKLSQLV
jgi:hypothetical protein